jgi:hypothetical protein
VASFKDKTGKEWLLEIDFDLADEIVAKHGVDLIDLAKLDETYSLLAFSDTRKLLAVVWMLCESQAKSEAISDKDFRSRIGPTSLGEMKIALEESIILFSQSPESMEAKRKLFRAANSVLKLQIEAISEDALEAVISAASDGSGPDQSAVLATSGS